MGTPEHWNEVYGKKGPLDVWWLALPHHAPHAHEPAPSLTSMSDLTYYSM